MRHWLIGFLFLLSTPALAQDSLAAPAWIGGAYAQGGFIIAHSPFMRHLAVSHPTGAELNLQKQTNGSKAWHQLYKFPTVGYSLVYFDFHNPRLGQSVALTTYVNKTIQKSRNGRLNYRLGVGLAYLSRIYDQETNFKNSVASSFLNAALQTRFEYEYRLSGKVFGLIGLGLNHYSNGATSKPNLGINIPTLSLGLNYHTVPEPVFTQQPLPEFSGKWFATASTTMGWRQISALIPEKFLVQSFTLTANKPLNRKSHLVLGLEGFYDRSLKVQQQTDTTLIGKPFPDTKKAGLLVGHDLWLGDLALELQLGYYIYRPYKAATPYYERLGLKYNISRHLFAALNLKVHAFAADVVEFRLGYKF